MHRLAKLAPLLFVAACGGTTGGISDVELTQTRPMWDDISARPQLHSDVQFETLLNNVRSINGVGAVSYDSRLGGAAQAHADDMLVRDYFAHVTPEGLSASDRAAAVGYDSTYVGENIAQGQTSQAAVMDAWTDSPGHHANNINPNFQDFGLGMSGSGSETRWVLVLGRE